MNAAQPHRHTLRRRLLGSGLALALGLSLAPPPAEAQTPARPNILMIMADDVGYWNVGAYSHGMMVPTPNLDRIAREGMLFTDHYAEPTCTPGRAAFITGQMPIRTGLHTVGLPGSPIGLDARDPTLATVLRGQGYLTAQIGKNHLGDLNRHLPTVHGFESFFGNLYHLNTEEEPEDPDWPRDAGFNSRYRPRGVLDCVALAEENPEPATDARFGPWGRQRCTDTGPLTRARMPTVDDEFVDRTLSIMERSTRENRPFFIWHNPTRMHINTHLRPENRLLAQPFSSGDDLYGAGMMELDAQVGRLLDRLESLGQRDNTIVLFTSDNGAMSAWWPDGGTTPFRSEKATTWEGGVRVPMLVRWPGRIPAGRASNGIQSHLDLFTTLAAAAGVPDVRERLRASHNVMIDGVNNLAHWTEGQPSARDHLFYYNAERLTALRFGPWKSHFETREGFFDSLRPSALLFNLRMDPFEQRDGHRSNLLAMRKAFLGGVIRDLLAEHQRSLAAFPPRQAGGSLRPQP
jgi:arylsulfatase A-like enzyme